MNGRKIFSFVCLCFLLVSAGCKTPTPSSDELETPPIEETQVEEIEQISPEPVTGTSRVTVIFDDDGSRDGMAALFYLLSIPEVSIEAVSISYGEAHPDQYIQLVGQALEQIGVSDIPLGAGQDAPLAGGTPFPDWLRALGERFWDYALPQTDKVFPFTYAPDLFVEVINNSIDPVTIFLSGPFTNLAQALEIDPGIKENISAVYFMGGAVYGPGNITNLVQDSSNKVAEWNIIADPQAAKDVFAAGLEMYMIPLDATNKVIHVQDEITPWHDGDEKANFSADLYDIMFDDYGLEQVEIFDQTAAVVMMRPDLCEFEFLAMDVITEAGDTQGQTFVVSGGEPNIHVCIEPDVVQIKAHLDAVYTDVNAPPTSEEVLSTIPIAGTWKGLAYNTGNDFELETLITIQESCQLGEKCGTFDFPNVDCSGIFKWTELDGGVYRFEAEDKSDGCGEGVDYLEPLSDGTLRYFSQGDYGETEGILEKQP